MVSEVFLVAWRRLVELPADPLPWLLVTAGRAACARRLAGGGPGAETWWVSPATWLPVRTLTVNSAVSIQVDYGFLPPTPANIAKLKVTIPAGFTRTPTIQK